MILHSSLALTLVVCWKIIINKRENKGVRGNTADTHVFDNAGFYFIPSDFNDHTNDLREGRGLDRMNDRRFCAIDRLSLK